MLYKFIEKTGLVNPQLTNKDFIKFLDIFYPPIPSNISEIAFIPPVARKNLESAALWEISDMLIKRADAEQMHCELKKFPPNAQQLNAIDLLIDEKYYQTFGDRIYLYDLKLLLNNCIYSFIHKTPNLRYLVLILATALARVKKLDDPAMRNKKSRILAVSAIKIKADKRKVNFLTWFKDNRSKYTTDAATMEQWCRKEFTRFKPYYNNFKDEIITKKRFNDLVSGHFRNKLHLKFESYWKEYHTKEKNSYLRDLYDYLK